MARMVLSTRFLGLHQTHGINASLTLSRTASGIAERTPIMELILNDRIVLLIGETEAVYWCVQLL